jgi:prepilin-type N-terminal cleavage/methylation domain-containing protein
MFFSGTHPKRGFTLVEFLIIIAIIGILASMILISLKSSKEKAKDARVAIAVKEAKSLLDIGQENGVFQDLVCSNNCSTTIPIDLEGNGTVAPSAPHKAQFDTLGVDATNIGYNLTYQVTINEAGGVTAFAIYGSLPSYNNTKYFCIDSMGKTNQKANANNTISCPS